MTSSSLNKLLQGLVLVLIVCHTRAFSARISPAASSSHRRSLSLTPLHTHRHTHKLSVTRPMSSMHALPINTEDSAALFDELRGGNSFSHTHTSTNTNTDSNTNSNTESSIHSHSAAERRRMALHVFVNRDVDMQAIEAVGFDMDFTLAQYNTAFDRLAYDGAKHKLVHTLHYPPELLSLLQYTPHHCQRGCLIDKRRGNAVKLDQYHYATNAEHGLRALSREERKQTYRSLSTDIATRPSDFYNIDTPFSLVDACLFLQMVDLRDRCASFSREQEEESESESVSVRETEIERETEDNVGQQLSSLSPSRRMEMSLFFRAKSYAQLWLDMRKCIDRCHFDGAIKHTVALDPAKYILRDPQLIPMLQSFREAGKKVFLLTNSLWDYSHVVMNFLEGGKTGEEKDLEWTKYFDLIVVGANKPAFLNEQKTLPMYRIRPEDETLSPIDFLPDSRANAQQFLQTGKFFQGGNFAALHRLLDISCGESVLYVGDHIFADILKSKRTLGWRTCLIVPELLHEIKVLRAQRAKREELMDLRRRQYVMESELDVLHIGAHNASSRSETLSKDIADREEELERLRATIRKNLREFDAAFHPSWGPIFKAGFQDSRLSQQVRDWACLYTSKASNLGLVSPLRPFRPPRDKMAHDHMIEGLQ